MIEFWTVTSEGYWSLYWFMFPVALIVSSIAMASGIGGAALFMPLFVLVFPLLGPEYVFESVAIAALVSLITMSFSFASGVSAYALKRSIDYRVAGQFLFISVPVSLIAAWVAPLFLDWVLLLLYSAMILFVSALLLKPLRNASKKPTKTPNRVLTLIGAFTTGTSSVGIGEVVIPQLLRYDMSAVRAAGTSVLVVFVTVLSSSTILAIRLTQYAELQVPWNVICYTIPGVLIGAQIGPRLQEKLPQDMVRKAIATLFLVIAALMIWVVAKKLS